MNLNQNYIKRRLYFDNRSVVRKDLYLNVFLTKTYELHEYVDVQRDDDVFFVEKQNINPYYIDFGFFDTTKRIKVNNSSDLSVKMIEYLNEKYFEVISIYGDVKTWFDVVGYNVLSKNITTITNPGTGETIKESEIEYLEKIQLNVNSVVSKSHYFPIKINK